MSYQKSRFIIGVVLWILLFLLINFDSSLGNVFVAILIGAAWLFTSDNRRFLFIEKANNNRAKSLMLVAIGYAAFMISSFIALAFLGYMDGGGITSLNTIYGQFLASLMAQYSPILAENLLLVFLSWGTIIPIVESFSFFQVLLEFLCDYVFKTKRISIYSFKSWLAVLFVAGVFTFFHITAKGLENDPAFVMTFLFAVISGALVLYTGQSFEAIILHIVNNSAALLISGQVVAGVSAVVTIGVVGGAIMLIYFITKKFRPLGV